METGKERLLLMDGIRGFAIVNMILFHFLYDFFIIYQRDPIWYERPWVFLWQQMICWTFILISGMTWNLGRRKVRRGILLNFWGLVITVITWLIMPHQTVWFGILNFLGCACLLLIPLEKILKKIPAVLGMLGSVFCFFLFQNISVGYLGIGESEWFSVPQWLYDTKVFTILGFPFPGFYSSDYFPVLPWIFLFFLGYYISLFLQKKAKLYEKFYINVPLLTKIGQKSLIIYLLHQPLCMLVCTGVIWGM